MHEDKSAKPDEFYKQASDVLGTDFWQEIGSLLPITGPRMDVYYTSSAVFVLAELPELQHSEQITMRVEGQSFVIEGEVPCPYPVTDNRIMLKERFFGRFVRTLPLPRPVVPERINARYRQGLLTVELPVAPSTPHTHISLQL